MKESSQSINVSRNTILVWYVWKNEGNKIISVQRLRSQTIRETRRVNGRIKIHRLSPRIHAHNVLRHVGEWYSGWLSHSPWWLCKELRIHQPTLFPSPSLSSLSLARSRHSILYHTCHRRLPWNFFVPKMGSWKHWE